MAMVITSIRAFVGDDQVKWFGYRCAGRDGDAVADGNVDVRRLAGGDGSRHRQRGADFEFGRSDRVPVHGRTVERGLVTVGDDGSSEYASLGRIQRHLLVIRSHGHDVHDVAQGLLVGGQFGHQGSVGFRGDQRAGLCARAAARLR